MRQSTSEPLWDKDPLLEYAVAAYIVDHEDVRDADHCRSDFKSGVASNDIASTHCCKDVVDLHWLHATPALQCQRSPKHTSSHVLQCKGCGIGSDVGGRKAGIRSEAAALVAATRRDPGKVARAVYWAAENAGTAVP